MRDGTAGRPTRPHSSCLDSAAAQPPGARSPAPAARPGRPRGRSGGTQLLAAGRPPRLFPEVTAPGATGTRRSPPAPLGGGASAAGSRRALARAPGAPSAGSQRARTERRLCHLLRPLPSRHGAGRRVRRAPGSVPQDAGAAARPGPGHVFPAADRTGLSLFPATAAPDAPAPAGGQRGGARGGRGREGAGRALPITARRTCGTSARRGAAPGG